VVERKIHDEKVHHMSELRTVLLADGSRLLREMLRRVIEKTEGLRVVAEVERTDRLVEEIKEYHPDWLILFQRTLQTMPDVIEHLLQENRDLRIAILSANGDQLRIKWIEYHDETLQDLTWNIFSRSLREERSGKQT
jgi:chemotaxis response regulator CheB